MTGDRYTDYDEFAWLYNRHWSKRLIDQIFGTIEDHLLKHLPPGSRILDVCCGNGHLAAAMSAQGFQVTGIDGSEAMLKFARGNAPTAEFHPFDARSFRFDARFAAAISTCDSLNHIMSLQELTRAFINVHAVLEPGGLFLFDLNTEKGYRDYWTGNTTGRVEPDNAFILKLSYDEQKQVATFAVTIFRLRDDCWRRTDALLTQQYYAPETILGALTTAGFQDIALYDVEKDLGVDGTGRVMFVMRKGS